MHKIILIIKREYTSRVKKKIFLITTLLAPLLMVAFIGVVFFIGRPSTEIQRLAVADESGLFKKKMENKGNILFFDVNTPFSSLKTSYKQAGYSGIIHVPANYDIYNASVPIEYFTDKQIGFGTQSAIEDELTEVVTAVRLNNASSDLTAAKIKKLSENVPMKITIGGAEGEKKGNAPIATAVGTIMGFLLYFIILIYGVMVMRGIMEEKVNRIAEVIISSVKPFQLMMGKIVGIAMVGLTQFAIWIILFALIWGGLGIAYSKQLKEAQKTMQSSPMSQGAMVAQQQQIQQQMGAWQSYGKTSSAMAELPVPLLIFGLVFYFFGGYMLYASLFAAVGSATGDEPEQGQALSLIATMPIIISFFIMIKAIQDPNSTLAVFASIFPLTSPIVMCGRLPFEPPLWQVISSMLALILFFVFTVWLAGKIYRTGILMYGKKVTLRDLGKWIMYKN